ncbi:MAG: SSU rRNA (adenine(1518)-N(6)/adenine(1519)-N(6))-dimethyltransferase, partial [uncultured Rubrobacteraceae bacterium]
GKAQTRAPQETPRPALPHRPEYSPDRRPGRRERRRRPRNRTGSRRPHHRARRKGEAGSRPRARLGRAPGPRKGAGTVPERLRLRGGCPDLRLCVPRPTAEQARREPPLQHRFAPRTEAVGGGGFPRGAALHGAARSGAEDGSGEEDERLRGLRGPRAATRGGAHGAQSFATSLRSPAPRVVGDRGDGATRNEPRGLRTCEGAGAGRLQEPPQTPRQQPAGGLARESTRRPPLSGLRNGRPGRGARARRFRGVRARSLGRDV